ncbi:hypothetical protein EO98_00980 [Methanosarcina sp. 2.H.T.1A.6]|uniref:DUF1835 domain-containing protein n=1 Tax=unclassified Methanosarcina TaxID=2644672 RepID=UPI0006216BB0|nr:MULTISPECIES: DUF1835 domain-containing protein [unclassified Methanosarcina]KKG13899.1 hypothetical protein EO94_19445 [Methanosarcina sp. 2.H.T.1A.3]KKG17813.1 hypothetical protein EO97_20435 [Methanosarcina sp. 2.H.T.1A.15]KKG21649.1 hypothetical protein EO96_03715 [Methanosarcina sp. 2.H.T.1A.8]KKG25090.1 hypothetical protein EO98_00980 [Methanosarcina sp. 2.H.T.1A.6]
MTTKTVHIIFTESAWGSLKFVLRGNPGENVLALPDDLSLGPISPYDLEKRKNILNPFLQKWKTKQPT